MEIIDNITILKECNIVRVLNLSISGEIIHTKIVFNDEIQN